MDDRIDFGDRWWQTIVQALRSSAAFVVVMAPESERSEWVHREVLLALKERKPIFPLLLRGEGFPILVDRQYADVTGGRMPPDDFCDRLREVVPLPEPPEPPPPQRGPLPAWIWGVGGAVVLGVMVLLVVFGSRWNEWFAQGPTETPTRAPTPTPADTWVRPADGMVMVYVPAGEFEMGKKETYDERPVHTVALDAFWIDRTEVTNAQYALCVADGVCDEAGFANDADFNGDDYPVVGVSWYDANTYCSWVDARLPTEAEWEYAARGEQRYVYPWGDEFDCSLGNFDDETQRDDYLVPGGVGCDGYERTAPVGSFPTGASWCGALDLAGNVWEWVADWYDRDYYERSPTQNPLGPEEGDGKVLRGGSWNDVPYYLRSANRFRNPPDGSYGGVGFRCARGSE
jgi:formylglycine-generating enzyme required for sulfatase activity